jgi:hypothetical protein
MFGGLPARATGYILLFLSKEIIGLIVFFLSGKRNKNVVLRSYGPPAIREADLGGLGTKAI